MFFSLILVIFAVIITSISQILLKRGNDNDIINGKDFKLFLNLNRYTITAYFLLLITTLIGITALQVIPLKLFYAITSLNYIMVIGLSWFFLKENISYRMLIGIGFIIIGIIVFNF